MINSMRRVRRNSIVMRSERAKPLEPLEQNGRDSKRNNENNNLKRRRLFKR